MKQQREIEDMLDAACDATVGGTTMFRSMTYEDGVRAALEWVLDDDDDESPLE